MLRVYIDDSADQKQEVVVAAGGFVGFYNQWSKLSTLWRRRLKKDGVRWFHTTELYSFQDEIARVYRDAIKYPKPKGKEAAWALLNDLEAIIEESKVMGIAVCIPMKLYSEIRNTEPNAAEILPEDAFEMALQEMIYACANIVRDHMPEQRVAFICDDSNKSSRIAKVYSDFKKTNPKSAEYMAGLVHQDDKLFPQLQAADLMAHIARKRFVDFLNDPDKNIFTADQALRERLKRLNVHYIAAWDRKHAMAVLEHERQRRGVVA